MPYEWESAYRDERNKLIDGEQDYSKSYDKYVLTLSGGALALSVTFLHDIIGDGPIRAPGLVSLAWASFTLALAAALVAIHQSGPLFRDFRDILDRKAQHAGDGFSWTEVRTEQLKCRRLKLIDCLNLGSLALFLVGVILLMWFSACNFRGETSMAEKTPSLPKVVNEGMKPPLAPVDGHPTTVDPARDTRAGKPPLAPVDVAPPQPPPSEPASSQGSGGKD